MTTRAYDAVLFDLLTALLDSWTLWNSVAGGEEAGRRWPAEYLKNTYAAGSYQPYEGLVAEAVHSVGLSRDLAKELAARYAELEPWQGVTVNALIEQKISAKTPKADVRTFLSTRPAD
jgi:2-haloacid dehalogenase